MKAEPGTGVSYQGVPQLTADLTQPGCASVQANLVPLIGDPKVWVVDVAGVDNTGSNQGVDGADLAQFLHEELNGLAPPYETPTRQRARADFTVDGRVDGSDVSRMINFVTGAPVSGSSVTRNRLLGVCP